MPSASLGLRDPLARPRGRVRLAQNAKQLLGLCEERGQLLRTQEVAVAYVLEPVERLVRLLHDQANSRGEFSMRSSSTGRAVIRRGRLGRSRELIGGAFGLPAAEERGREPRDHAGFVRPKRIWPAGHGRTCDELTVCGERNLQQDQAARSQSLNSITQWRMAQYNGPIAQCNDSIAIGPMESPITRSSITRWNHFHSSLATASRASLSNGPPIVRYFLYASIVC
jgi:hypothetical protein